MTPSRRRMSRGDCPARGASGRSNGGVSGRCIVSLWRSMLFRAGACPPERTVRGFERVHPGPCAFFSNHFRSHACAFIWMMVWSRSSMNTVNKFPKCDLVIANYSEHVNSTAFARLHYWPKPDPVIEFHFNNECHPTTVYNQNPSRF